ncbi:DDB1- and CUL4-associated factor 13 [Pancytospora epiphaga]|nr:DDB1- and CUL4-associated factor 13 [Pancytospora epiphaga]
MKIDTIYHSVSERRKERKGDCPVKKYSKNPVHHPFILEREYVRALNATKVDRLLAKPFVASLCGNTEGITHLIKSPDYPFFATASYDSQVTLWDMNSRSKINSTAYSQPISAICMDWAQNIYASQGNSVFSGKNEYVAESTVTGLDYSSYSSGNGDISVASLDCIQIFDISRFTPKYSYKCRGTSAVKYNSSFRHLMAGISQLHVDLLDNRACKKIATIPVTGSNCGEFNPKEGYVLALGNEDGTSYTYDIRNLEKPLGSYRGHVNAVVSLAYHPGGEELATGSFDRTIRIFRAQDRKSRDCYYNSRMHIVHGVMYSNDGQFIISGSDDGSLRLWKAEASRKTGPISRMERESMEYKEVLKEKFKDIGEVARISKHRFLPKDIKQASKQQHEMYEARLRREARRKEEEEMMNE